MISLAHLVHGQRPMSVLCVGAHCDDIEIGCGGALLAMQAAGIVRQIDWAVLSGGKQRQVETLEAMRRLVGSDVRGEALFGGFADGSLPGQYREAKEFFELLKQRVSPHLIFTHEREDRHQDHRIANEMTWNTFRDNLILEYEIPKWDGGLAQPNFFVPLDKEQVGIKVSTILECHGSQGGRHWFTRETFEGLLRLRGIEIRARSGWAEAFHCRKFNFELGQTD